MRTSSGRRRLRLGRATRRSPRRDGVPPLRLLHANAALLRTLERMVVAASARGVLSVGWWRYRRQRMKAEGADAALRETALVAPEQKGTPESYVRATWAGVVGRTCAVTWGKSRAGGRVLRHRSLSVGCKPPLLRGLASGAGRRA